MQFSPSENEGRDRRGVNLRVRPRFGVGDLILQLWRSLWLMILIFLPIAAIGIGLATTLPKKYQAVGRIQVSLDNQYVYDPIVGDAGRGALIETEAIVNAEVQKANSPVLARRVLDSIGLQNVYPKTYSDMMQESDPNKRDHIKELAYTSASHDFLAWAGTKSPLISFAFTHEDPRISAEVTNAFIDEYQLYRGQTRNTKSADVVATQSARFAADLAIAENELKLFLVKHNIGDFDADREATARLLASLQDQLLSVEARGKEASGRVAGLQTVMADTPEEIDLHIDSDGQQKLQDLILEREQLLQRYRPESQAVSEINSRIEAMQSVLAQGNTGGVRRHGPNPAYQEMEKNYANAQSEVEASKALAAELRKQVEQVSARQMKLISLLPEFKRLDREVRLLEDALNSLKAREQAERAEVEISKDNSNIFVVDYAQVPTKGSSMKIPAALASILFAGFTALIGGLLRAFTRKGLSTRRSVEKTIGLPVVGATTYRRA